MSSLHSFEPAIVLPPLLLGCAALGLLPREASGQSFAEYGKSTWFVRGGARLLQGVEATVESAPRTPQTPGMYDNGFVLPDAGGTASGLTWNWGYESADQISGDTLQFERYGDLPDAGNFSEESDSFEPGYEVMAGFEFSSFEIGGKVARFGAEVGYGWSPLSVDHRGTASGTVSYFSASHDLNGITPPLAPYSGTFQGPGPVIGLNPATSSTLTSPATSSFAGELESDLHQLKAGLWFEYFPADRFSLALSLGYSSIYPDTTLSFSETYAITNPSIPAFPNRTVSVQDAKWHPGAYGQLRGSYFFTETIGAYLAGDYQYNNKFSFAEAGKRVTLDMKSIYSLSAGFIFTF